MTNLLAFKIVTPQGVAYEDEIEQITLPTAAGEITVLPNHTPLVSLLVPGEMTVKKEKNTVHFAVAHGVVEIRSQSKVVVLSDTAQRAEEIDIEQAQSARIRANKMLEEKENINDVDYARFRALLDSELNRIKVGRKYLKK